MAAENDETHKLNSESGPGEPFWKQQNERLRKRGIRSAAIKLFCRQCVCVGEGGTRDDVTNCTATDCALYPFRPYQLRSTK